MNIFVLKWSKIAAQKKVFFSDFALVHPPMASVLRSASVERCFVSRMRDFSFCKRQTWNITTSVTIHCLRNSAGVRVQIYSNLYCVWFSVEKGKEMIFCCSKTGHLKYTEKNNLSFCWFMKGCLRVCEMSVLGWGSLFDHALSTIESRWNYQSFFKPYLYWLAGICQK